MLQAATAPAWLPSSLPCSQIEGVPLLAWPQHKGEIRSDSLPGSPDMGGSGKAAMKQGPQLPGLRPRRLRLCSRLLRSTGQPFRPSSGPALPQLPAFCGCSGHPRSFHAGWGGSTRGPPGQDVSVLFSCSLRNEESALPKVPGPFISL